MELTTNQWLWAAAVLQAVVMLTLGTISLHYTLKLYANTDVSRQHDELSAAVLDWFNWLSLHNPNDAAAHQCVVNAALALRPGFFTTRPETFLKQLARGRRELARAKALCDLPVPS